MLNDETSVVHITTVHNRTDVRIRTKQVASLSEKYGSKVRLLVLDGLDDERDNLGYSIVSVGRSPRGRIDRFTRGSVLMFLACRRLKPRVVHFHDVELIFVCLLLKLFGYLIVYDVHEDVPRQIKTKHYIPKVVRAVFASAATAMEGMAALFFDGIVCATGTIAARFPKSKTVLVRNYPALRELGSVRRDEPNVDSSPSFLYIGGITHVRGSDNMLAALSKVSTQKEVRLNLAGQFQPSSHEQELRTRSGWNQVDFHGWVNRKEIAALLASSIAGLVVLHPIRSYQESLPVKLFEYMAAGLPVIASDFTSWRQIVSESNAGILVDPTSIDEIAAAMQWILDNPEQGRQMGQYGCDAVRKYYNWENETTQLFALYNRLMPSI